MNTKTILLVEDNPSDEALTLRALKKSGIVNGVTVARDGAEALDYLFREGAYTGRGHESEPTIIMLDLNLPKIGGLDVLKSIRANESTKLLPIVVLTSSDLNEDIIASYKLGANSYVRKPVESRKFSNAVQDLGLYWLLLNTAPTSIVRDSTLNTT
jgi:two-component system response regulator